MDKENKGMRLVAMIGKKNSDEYEVINFLPDIKVKYIKKNEFVVVENINYIKIPYAKGIDDLTVIVGENGVGKTRLVNTISNISSKEILIYRSGNDYFVNRIDEIVLKDKGNNYYYLNLITKDDLSIIKFSNSIETSIADCDNDISTSKILSSKSLEQLNVNDMDSQIKFIFQEKINKHISEVFNFSDKKVEAWNEFRSPIKKKKEYLDFDDPNNLLNGHTELGTLIELESLTDLDLFEEYIYEFFDTDDNLIEYGKKNDIQKKNKTYYEFLIDKMNDTDDMTDFGISKDFLYYLKDEYNINYKKKISKNINKFTGKEIDLSPLYFQIIDTNCYEILEKFIIHIYCFMESEQLLSRLKGANNNLDLITNFLEKCTSEMEYLTELPRVFMQDLPNGYDKFQEKVIDELCMFLKDSFTVIIEELNSSDNIYIKSLHDRKESRDMLGKCYRDKIRCTTVEIKKICNSFKIPKDESFNTNSFTDQELEEEVKREFIEFRKSYEEILDYLKELLNNSSNKENIDKVMIILKELPNFVKSDIMDSLYSLLELTDFNYMQLFYYCDLRESYKWRISDVINHLKKGYFISKLEVLQLEKLLVFFDRLQDSNFFDNGSFNFLVENISALFFIFDELVDKQGFKQIIEFQKSVFFKWHALSSGEYSFLNLFGRVFECSLNNLESNILLIFDEVDLGLHPEWQRRWVSTVLPIISDIFKDRYIQVIITTHSPIMLSDVFSENVIKLRKDRFGNRKEISDKTVFTFGQNIHTIFKDTFFLDSIKGKFAVDKINEVLVVLRKMIDCQKDNYIQYQIYHNLVVENAKRNEYDISDISIPGIFSGDIEKEQLDSVLTKILPLKEEYCDETIVAKKRTELIDDLKKEFCKRNFINISKFSLAIKKIIDSVGEDILRRKMLDMYYSVDEFCKMNVEGDLHLLKKFMKENNLTKSQLADLLKGEGD